MRFIYAVIWFLVGFGRSAFKESWWWWSFFIGAVLALFVFLLSVIAFNSMGFIPLIISYILGFIRMFQFLDMRRRSSQKDIELLTAYLGAFWASLLLFLGYQAITYFGIL